MKLDTSNEYDYDIMSALRGPDGPEGETSNTVKYMYTGVVRHFAGVSDVSYALCSTPEQAQYQYNKWMDDEQREELRRRWINNPHYASHIVSAFSALLNRFRSEDQYKYEELRNYLDWLKERGLYV